MNKYLGLACIAALFAIAAGNVVMVHDEEESQLSLVPGDSEETANLKDQFEIFNSFCLETRDFVVKDIKGRSNSKAASVFSVFFNGAEELGKEAVTVQREATERLANQMRNPDSPIYEGEVDNAILNGQQKIQDSGVAPTTFLGAITSTLAATKNAVTGRVLNKFDEFKGMLGIAAFTGALKDVCNLVDEYDQAIQAKFDKFVAGLGPEMRSTKLEQVPCVTARRVIRVDGICKFAMAAQQPLIKAITYRASDL